MEWIWRSPFCEVRRCAGYRLLRLKEPQSAQTSTALRVQLEVTNDGFGGICTSRAIELILRPKGGQPIRLMVDTPQDTRPFLPAPGEDRLLTLSTLPPAGLTSGQYGVQLALPDPMISLRTGSGDCIRLANENVWETATGFNALGQTLEIRP